MLSRATVAALLLVLGAATLLLLMWHLLGGDDELTSPDLVTLVKPHYTLIKAQLGRGELPLWNPHVVTGIPELAQGQWGALYPVQALLLGLLEVPTYIKVSVLLHLLLLVAASWLLAASLLDLTRPPAGGAGDTPWLGALAALVVTCSGFTMGHLQAGHVMLIQALPWVLLTAWAGVACVRGRRWAGAALAVCCAMIALAGGPQILPMGLAAALAVWIAVLSATARGAGGWRRPALRLLLFTAGGLALAGVQLLPTLELAGLSSRAQTGVGAVAARLTLGLSDLGGLLLPTWVEATRPEVHWEFAGFVGPPVVALALVPLLLPGTRRPALILWLAVALLLFGASRPGHALLSQIPVYNLLRVPARLLLPAVILLALLGAVGLQQALRSERARRLAALLVAVLGLLSLLLAVEGGRWQDQVTLGWTLAAAAALGLPRRRPAPTRRPAVMLGAILLAGWTALALVSAERFPGRPARLVQLPRRVAGQLARQAPRHRVLTYRPDSWNHGLLHGFRNLGGYVPFAPGRSGLLLSTLEVGAVIPGRAARPTTVAWPMPGQVFHDRLWDLFGVRLVHADRRFVPPRGFVLLERSARRGLTLHDNPAAYARAYFSACPLAAKDGQDALRLLLAAPEDAARSGGLAALEGIRPRAGCVEPGAGRAEVRFVRDDPTLVELALRAPGPGYLVLTDLHYPGWRAELDGAPAPLLHANAAGRAVAVPAGEHRVRMTFAPGSLRAGLVVTAAAALLIALLSWWRRLWRRAPPLSSAAGSSSAS